MGEINAYRILIRKPKGKKCSGDLSVDGRILLKWILNKILRCELRPSGSG
jgi:hypothetical protein